MADAFVGEIRMFSGNFVPRGWLLCDGRELPVVEFEILFSIIVDLYGGDGVTNFRLPDLRARAPLHAGVGPGLSIHQLSDGGGYTKKYIAEENMPAHRHTVVAKSGRATDAVPSEKSLPAAAYLEVGPPPVRNKAMYKDYTDDQDLVRLDLAAVQGAGNMETDGIVYPDNCQPFLTSTFIICYDGMFPASD